MGPELSDYVESTKSGLFGAFQLKLGDRDKFFKDARTHIERLIQELDKRFKPSPLRENLSILFDYQYLSKK